jgi:glycosyltransferase involved in cell wall biosynthesis
MKFSITIPAYKSRFLDEAIRSVVSQICPDWELIIVDDCSPEPLKEIVEPFLTDQRVRFYRNAKNCGAVDVVDNWNICLSHCTGDYIICMGDDDRLLPCCLDEYAKTIEAYHDLNVYHARTAIINEEGERVDVQEERPAWESCQEMILHQWKDRRKQFLGDFLFSRHWLLNNGGYVKFPLAYCSDWATANLAAKERGIANGQTFMFEYRSTPYSISRSQNLRIAVSSCKLAHEWYLQSLPDMLPPFHDRYFTTQMTDMIYSDVKQKPLSSTLFWLFHGKGLGINYTKIAEVCVRGVLASFLK